MNKKGLSSTTIILLILIIGFVVYTFDLLPKSNEYENCDLKLGGSEMIYDSCEFATFLSSNREGYCVTELSGPGMIYDSPHSLIITLVSPDGHFVAEYDCDDDYNLCFEKWNFVKDNIGWCEWN